MTTKLPYIKNLEKVFHPSKGGIGFYECLDILSKAGRVYLEHMEKKPKCPSHPDDFETPWTDETMAEGERVK